MGRAVVLIVPILLVILGLQFSRTMVGRTAHQDLADSPPPPQTAQQASPISSSPRAVILRTPTPSLQAMPSDTGAPTHYRLPPPVSGGTFGAAQNIDQLYLELSRSADFVIYGQVRSDLGRTREETTDRLGTMARYYNHYLIKVIDSVVGLGGSLMLPAPPTAITIRDQSTTVAPTYMVGQSFVGFITVDQQHGTYRSVYQPLPVSERNGEAYVSDTDVKVSDFLRSLQRSQ